MKTKLSMWCIVAAASAFLAPVRADDIELTAVDTKGITPTGQNWNDNRLRSYTNPPGIISLDGLMKFDFSAIPDGATIEAMTLVTYHEEGFGNPSNDPQVSIFRVANDSWSRGPTDPHPGLNEELTEIKSGFPSGNLTPYEWELDVNAANWDDDLDDDVLSLAMRNHKDTYSYVYWHGSDQNPAPPKLFVTFSTSPHCHYVLKKSKAKGGCGLCPEKGSTVRSQQECGNKKDCDKKLKTTLACPEGPGVCKLKGKRSACD